MLRELYNVHDYVHTVGQRIDLVEILSLDANVDNVSRFSGNQACKGNRVFQIPRIGVADDKVAHYASIHYYVDKELQVNRLFTFYFKEIRVSD